MVDIPASTSTTASITVGGTVTGSLEVVGDHDWFKITLAAGQSVTITLNGTTLEDPYLRIRNASGTVIHENDDISSGINRDSRVSFTASTGGTYYIDVGAWDEGYAGQYQLSVTNYVPPALWTYDQIADQLTSGYWGGDTHRFNVSAGGQLTVNLTALTTAGRELALAALATWTDIIGVNFVAVTSGGQITFDDNEEGAFSESSYSGSFITSSHVNVNTAWIADYGTGLNTYSFQTYIHEIGHALGLGHAGNYNGDATYQSDALFRNDSWATTVMSYFSQTENNYFADLGFDRNFVTTPMIADIVAMQDLYGLSTTTRSGNTTYGSGWHTNMGALCIFDSGGIDRIDVSGMGGNQRIDLNPGSFSNIMDEVGNVSIALGVIIENARSSSGHDTLIGNDADNELDSGAGNDSLSGGAGNDWLIPGWGNNSVDGGSGIDTVDYVIGTTAASNVNLGLGTATNQGGAGQDTLTSIENVRGTTYDDTIVGNGGDNLLEGHFGKDNISGGGGNDTLVGDTLESSIGYDDILNGGTGSDRLIGGTGTDILTGGAGDDTFQDSKAGLNGDTITDFAVGDRIVVTDASLAAFSFNLTGSTLTYTGGSLTLSGPISGSLVASAAVGGGVQLTIGAAAIPDADNDFNGDGRSDILMRNDNGAITNFLGTASGGILNNGDNVYTVVGNAWSLAGTGDFNGDGRDDVLWRNDNGAVFNFLGTTNGGVTNNGNNSYLQLSASWTVSGVGDFNGDGRDDILFRDANGVIFDYLGTATGGFVGNTNNLYTDIADAWDVAGIGDFNGDGRDDILFRNTNGAITNFLGTANGGIVNNGGNVYTAVGSAWHVAGTGDFNGDGRDDVLWRNDNGAVFTFLSTANGGVINNGDNSYAAMSNVWHVEAIGDYNGDGRDDILWRHDNGTIIDWLGTASGGFADNSGNLFTQVALTWHVQDPGTLWV